MKIKKKIVKKYTPQQEQQQLEADRKKNNGVQYTLKDIIEHQEGGKHETKTKP